MRAEGRGSSAEAFLRGRLAEAHVFSHAKNAIENGCFVLYVGPGREVRNRCNDQWNEEPMHIWG